MEWEIAITMDMLNYIRLQIVVITLPRMVLVLLLQLKKQFNYLAQLKCLMAQSL